MVLVTDHDKFIELMQEEIQRRLRPEEQQPVLAFASLFFSNFPLEELLGREVADVFGVLYANWSFVQDYDGGAPHSSIYNPTLELHGWQSHKTVIQVLVRDMPFIVGSMMAELNNRGISIHTIHNTVIHTHRDSQGKLLDVRGRNDDSEGLDPEALVYLEITRTSDNGVLKELELNLQSVLAEVDTVVVDWHPMTATVRDALARLENSDSPNREDGNETTAFLQWMLANHFTFLGYQWFDVQGQSGDEQLQCDPSSALGLMRKGYGELHEEQRSAILKKHVEDPDNLLLFGRYSAQSRIQRRAYAEMIFLWSYDSAGQLAGAHCFMGLYTSIVHTASVRAIPLLREKVGAVLDRAGYAAHSHNGREIIRILETFPRGELFHISEEQLYAVTVAVFRIRERNQVRLFMAVDAVFGFVSCLVYVPRVLYNTSLRMRISSILANGVNAIDSDFTTFFSESVLARTHFIFRISPGYEPLLDNHLLEQELVAAAKSWPEHLRETLVEELGEEKGTTEVNEFLASFPPGYQDRYEPRLAVNDIRQIRNLSDSNMLGMSFYRALEDKPEVLHFRLLRAGESLILSDVIPILENFGLRAVAESCHTISGRSGEKYAMQEFTLQYAVTGKLDLEITSTLFKQAFYRVWSGDSESDAFNKLLLAVRLDWRQIAMVRAYARYIKQLGLQFSESFIADTLFTNAAIAAELVRLFEQRFDPVLAQQNADAGASEENRCREGILTALEQVKSLNEDRVIRHFLSLIDATLRTNYYQRDSEGAGREYLSLKINTASVDGAPLPRPEFEIFVYSPRIEGVHLRSGKVARGGLRWSDRYEDYRTEVLGLVKAQQVKNAIIVPVGAKGGFVCKRQPTLDSREEMQAEAIACYQIFIRGLLDITDNLVEGVVKPPRDVVRKDEDDVYLVVAADKGTASFSDIANKVAAEYSYWLGDAFASGGEYGYDHKKMGITARGAWVCVQRHFRELGINIQASDFTVVGIGDMSGDVFGNGMLLSEHIQLCAAFNHMHIFVDPNPDSARSFIERQRLFNKPGSSWLDYEKSLISDGGGVFLRSEKSIAISEPMRRRFAIELEALTPDQLIQALLKAPVDLLWNGGIGTYIKSSSESHTEVGDKANEPVRIDANELSVRVVGEGGNLGMTQLSRVEFGLAGGAVNTDFIDNAGGVNCSDHEVNIKILLDEVVQNGDLTIKQRNQLLESMTDAVAELVLQGCDQQALALSVAHSRADRGMEEYIRFIQSLASDGFLNRELEFIPEDEVLRERRAKALGFTRPELAVLSAYSKAQLKESLAHSSVPDEPTIASEVVDAFPSVMAEKYGEALQHHRLQREIVAMRVANDMINRGGITFAHRMRESTGANHDAIARGFIFANAVFRLEDVFSWINDLDYRVEAATQHELLDYTSGLLRGATRWFLRRPEWDQPLAEQIARLSESVSELWDNLSLFLQGSMEVFWQDAYSKYIDAGVDEKLAGFVAGGPILIAGLNIAEAAQAVSSTTLDVARLYFHIGEELGLTAFSHKIFDMKVDNHWQAIAREGLIDDIASEQKNISLMVLSCALAKEGGDEVECLQDWLAGRERLVERWRSALSEVTNATTAEFTMCSVVLRELANLSRVERH